MRVMIVIIILMVGSVLSLAMLPGEDTQAASGSQLEASAPQQATK